MTFPAFYSIGDGGWSAPGFPLGLAGRASLFAAGGAGLSVCGGFAAVFAGAVCVFALAGGVLGVGDGFACMLVLAGTGTRITPPSLGMNGLPVLGSMV